MAAESSTSIAFSYLSLDASNPSPEQSPSDYTPAKVQKRLEYARHVGRRNISPRSEIFLQLYRDAAINALAVTENKDRLDYCTQLYRYDKFLEANSFMGEEPTKEQKELEEKLLKLKRLEYYARYSDYWARELSLLKETALMVKTENYEELQQYWTTINEKLQADKNDKDWFEKELGKLDRGKMPTIIAVRSVAKELKLPTERVVWVIERYAERNLLVHFSVTELIQLGRWSKLADLLYHDAKDLALVIPPQMEDDIDKMSGIISSIKDKFFTVEEGDEDFPEAWRANEDANKYRKDLRAKTEAKDKTKADLVEAAVKRASEAAKKREKQAALVEKAMLGKRKASQEFPLGEAILAKKTREMEKVIGIQTQVESKEKELDRHYQKRDKAIDALGNLDIKEDSWVMLDGTWLLLWIAVMR